jgi:hypothetical protein
VGNQQAVSFVQEKVSQGNAVEEAITMLHKEVA